MKKQKKCMLLIGMISIACVLLLTLSVCVPTFKGDIEKNVDTYALEIQSMTGTDLHTMELSKGDVLQIQFETVKGSMYMEIKAPDGIAIYRGNGKETMEFTLNIQSDGVYVFCVEARRARGRVHIDVEKGTDLEAMDNEKVQEDKNTETTGVQSDDNDTTKRKRMEKV